VAVAQDDSGGLDEAIGREQETIFKRFDHAGALFLYNN
jgi:hypothetical protein